MFTLIDGLVQRRRVLWTCSTNETRSLHLGIEKNDFLLDNDTNQSDKKKKYNPKVESGVGYSRYVTNSWCKLAEMPTTT